MNIITAILVLAAAQQDEHVIRTWKKIQLSDVFTCEGAAIGDFNKDGKMDVAVGPFWYEGPDFIKKHQFAAEDFMAKPYDPKNYSKNFFAFVYDFNKDGWDDILIYGFPGEDASWYQNPPPMAQPLTAAMMGFANPHMCVQ